MKKTRLSVDIDEEEYKYLKMCCVKLGMTIKDFVLKATIERVDSWEDIWMLDRWEKDGTREEIERDRNNPEREVFALEFSNDDVRFEKTTYSNLERHAHGL